MKRFTWSIALSIAVVSVTITACNDNRNGDSNRMNSTDTNAIETRRNNSDTTNYLTKDSGNKSHDVVDPNPPQNSRY